MPCGVAALRGDDGDTLLMIWKSYIDTNLDAIHAMPDTNPPHEMKDTCWCRPDIAFPIREDGSTGLLVSHHLEDD